MRVQSTLQSASCIRLAARAAVILGGARGFTVDQTVHEMLRENPTNHVRTNRCVRPHDSGHETRRESRE